MQFCSVLLVVTFFAFSPLPLSAAQLNTTSTLVDTQSPATILSPETKFDPVIDDLPLVDGLQPVPDEATLFVTPRSGRIAESVAVGSVDVDEVYNFYKRALPHLGWKRLDARTYLRNKEKLRIDAHANGKVTTVHFSIKPE